MCQISGVRCTCRSDVYGALPLPYSIHKYQPESKPCVPSSAWPIISDIETPVESDSSALLASSPWGSPELPNPASTALAPAPAYAPAPSHHHRKKRRSKHRRASSSPSSRESEAPPAQEAPSLTSLVEDNEPVVSGGRHWAPTDEELHRTQPYGGRYAEDDDAATADHVSPKMSWLTYDTAHAYEPSEERGEGERPDDRHSYDSRSDLHHRMADQGAPPTRTTSSGRSSGHRNMSSIKKKIKQFEEEFERKFGYKPSHSEKMKHRDIKKYMQQLNKGRKDMKTGMKEGVAELVEAGSKVFPLSLLRCQESTVDAEADDKHAVTLHEVLERLRDGRAREGRPDDLQIMTAREMEQEKTALQKALLFYESLHGRPSSKDARQLARPLYDRYRQVKRCVARSEARAKESLTELAPIIEHVVMDFTLASPQHRASLSEEEITPPPLPDPAPASPPSPASSSPEESQCTVLGNLHSLPPHELRERRREARDNKKRARKNLRGFEERYEREHGCKPPREDRGAAEALYRDYKHAKAKLKFIEAIINKLQPREDDV